MIRFKKYIEEEIRRQPMAIPPGSNTQLQAIKFYPGSNVSGGNTTLSNNPAYNAWYNMNVLFQQNQSNNNQSNNSGGTYQPIPYNQFLEHWNQTYENIWGNPVGYGFHGDMSFDNMVQFWIGVFGIEAGLMLIGALCVYGGAATIGGISVISLLGGVELGTDIWDLDQLASATAQMLGMTEEEAQEYISYLLAQSATGSNASGILSVALRDVALNVDDMVRGNRNTLIKRIGENQYQIFKWNPKTNSWEPWGPPRPYEEIANSVQPDPAGGLNVPYYDIDDDLPGNPHLHEINPPPISPADMNMPIGPRPSL